METIYRPTHLSHVDDVWELILAIKKENCEMSFAELEEKNELVQWLEGKNLFLYIAECSDKAVGLLRATRGMEAEKRHAVTLSIAVHPDYRSQGIAKELINTGLEDIKKDGVKIARAKIYSDKIPSINTALRLGFTFAGSIFMHHYSKKDRKYVDDLIFHKILS